MTNDTTRYWEFDERGRRQLTEAGHRLIDEALSTYPDPLTNLKRFHPGTYEMVTTGRFRNARGDMRQAALVGIWEAARRYEPNARQVELGVGGFLAFASSHIRNQVQKEAGGRSNGGKWRKWPGQIAPDYDWDYGPSTPDHSEVIADEDERRHASEVVRRELDKLPPHHRDAVATRFELEGAPAPSHNALAAARGVTRQAVNQHCNVGLRQLEVALKELDVD